MQRVHFPRFSWILGGKFHPDSLVGSRRNHQKKYLRCVCPSIQSTLTEWERSTTASERIICCVLFCCSASAQLLSALHPRQSSGTHPQLTASFVKSSIRGLWTTWETRGENVKAALCGLSVWGCSLCCVASASTSYTQIASGALCVVLLQRTVFPSVMLKKTVSFSDGSELQKAAP